MVNALRSHSEPAAIQYQAARVLGEHLGTARAYYVEIDEARSEFIVARDWHQPGTPSQGCRYPVKEWAMPWLVDEQPWVVRDVATDPAMPDDQRESYWGNDIGALIVVPLVKNNRLVATLVINQHTPRNWTDDEVALVQETAERTWAGVERAYAEAALYESQQRLSAIFAQAAVGLSEISLSGRFLQVNNALCRLLERSRSDLLAASAFDVTHPDDLPRSLQALNQVMETGESVSLDKQYLRPDGTTIWANSILTRLDDDQGHSRSILTVTVDLSDRKLPTNLAQFTADLASVFRSAIERAGLRLIVDCPPLPEPVYVDREMWEKIIFNLLSNALKFTFTGDITVSLHSNNNHQVILEIRDTGSGIPPEHLPHLFERFYQIRGVQARTYEGSGIGLALVYELVRLQGGAIAVSSIVGEGTCFAITLPLGTNHLPPERIQSTLTLTSTAMGASPYVEEAERWLPKDSDPPLPPDFRGENSVKVPRRSGDLGGSPEVQVDARLA